MFEQLQASQGKNIAVELVNGRMISGTVLAVNEQYVRIETMEGVGSIPIKSIQIVWEPSKQTLTEKSMERLAEKLRDSVKEEIGCTGPQYGCSQQYVCRPPVFCSGVYTCPGNYAPGTCGPTPFGSQCNMPGGYSCPGSQQFYGVVGPLADVGGCPAVYCGSFLYGQACACQYQQPCGSQYAMPCMCMYQQPCDSQYAMPCVCMFQQPCGSQYAMPCVSMYQQPCISQYTQPCGSAFSVPCTTFQFQQLCGLFSFNATQCVTSSGYNCAVPFTGVTGPAAGTPAGMAPVSSPMPMDFTVKEEQKNKDEKEKE
ncbi:MAG: hypothetical protein A4E52_01134 [Pelotomaculum sp. PtaB.Bin013]|uniref:Uncharacterized protein n=1 Tax=Pelotomaculum isophthalicicum JI TaxID=947010 RepID=A0A9X4H0A0_9FIRM|nr:hypothetical protein [Pelotomaculum isophthalicicum]MDF9407131.1 hypothetical protein [Pelotomaculum isophthalicicum JI]OPX88963.1 MAG: hypothetical protein A4E52_01134 [Pelotomaculum sp. PtaB.Bin013]